MGHELGDEHGLYVPGTCSSWRIVFSLFFALYAVAALLLSIPSL